VDEVIVSNHYPKSRADLAKPPGEIHCFYVDNPSYYLKNQRKDSNVEARIDRLIWLRYCDIKRLNKIRDEILAAINTKDTPWYRKFYFKVKRLFY
jgi:hypothetical protein